MSYLLNKYGWLFLPLLIILVLDGAAFPASAQVTVRPGEPSHFKISAPPSAQSGIEFSLRLEILDIEDNRVKDYNQLDRTIELTTNGEGVLSKKTISSSSFENGRLTLSLTYSGADEIIISASERNHVANGRSKEVNFRPGPPADFVVDLPAQARAGELFTLGIEVRDAQGNRVTNYGEMTNGIVIQSTGTDEPSPQFVPAFKFRNGRAFSEISYKTAEEIQFVLIDEVNEIELNAGPIQIVPAGLDSFSVSTPGQVRAGQPFRMAIEARDRFQNIIRNYSRNGRGVDLETSEEGSVSPSFIPPSEFEDGVVFTRLTVTKSGSMRVIAQDRSSSAEGASDRMMVSAGPPTDFLVNLPEEIRAGETFRVNITAVDNYNNRVTDYKQIGEPVAISVRGRDEQIKSLEPADFESGQAEVELEYEKAGKVRLQIKAETANIAVQSPPLLVTPASPGEITIERTGVARAGKSFAVIFELLDSYGNRIHETEGLGGRVRAAILDHNTEQELMARPETMIDGKIQFSFRHDKAETIAIYAEYDRYDIRERSDYFHVKPGSFDRLAVRSPGTASAGEFFTIGMQLEDAFGNVLKNIPAGVTPIEIRSTGSGQVVPNQITELQINKPSFSIDARYLVAESIEIEFYDQNERKIGSSAPIRIQPAELHNFEIEVPDQVSADQSFPLRIIALDRYNNLLKNLNTQEGEIGIATDGAESIKPDTIRYREFVNGVAEVSATYRRAEMIHIHARGEEVRGVSEPLTVKPGSPSRFRVDMQERVQAGVPFPATINVFDKYQNKITKLSPDFPGVRLKAGGFEPVSPGHISGQLFEEGMANVYLIYPRSGELMVEAEVLTDSVDHQRIERVFIERGVEEALIHIVSSAKPQAKINSNVPGNQVKVEFQPAYLSGDENHYSFSNWFLNRVIQRQGAYKPLPKVELIIYPRDEVRHSKSLQNNLFTLKLERFETEIPTLQEIQSLILQENYSEAAEKLEIYLDENPDDPYATRLRYRLERIQEVTSP